MPKFSKNEVIICIAIPEVNDDVEVGNRYIVDQVDSDNTITLVGQTWWYEDKYFVKSNPTTRLLYMNQTLYSKK